MVGTLTEQSTRRICQRDNLSVLIVQISDRAYFIVLGYVAFLRVTKTWLDWSLSLIYVIIIFFSLILQRELKQRSIAGCDMIVIQATTS